MMGPMAAQLSGGRLHLQHGPIDLVIGADGARDVCFAAAQDRFETVLEDLVSELPVLRAQVGPVPSGRVARRMFDAVSLHRARGFVTPMAAVAGAVADEVLTAMVGAGSLRRAYVNNGGDIALWLAGGQTYRTAIMGTDRSGLGSITLAAKDGIGGIATSGRGGRSLSLGIADSVTVLARTAAEADAAATLIANAVDLPNHPAIRRALASEIDPDSDLGVRLVVTGCGSLGASEIRRALAAGLDVSKDMHRKGLIAGAILTLHDQTIAMDATEKDLCHA